MKKILILHFPSLNNYGTGMMGIITIQALAERYGAKNIQIYCDVNSDSDILEIKSELNTNVEIKRYINPTPLKISKISNRILKKLVSIFYVLFIAEGRGFSKIIVLGGDDYSEFYSKNGAAFKIFNNFKSSFVSPVVLLGQTMGPFNNALNRIACRLFLKRLTIFSRDKNTVSYMRGEFGSNLKLSADLAFFDLPLQFDKNIERSVLSLYGLVKDEYYTIVVSGLQRHNFYCKNETIYLERFKKIIELLSNEPSLKNKKICLLAHTFPPYGNESELIRNLATMLPNNLPDIVVISEKVLQTRARFILGNGLFSITGRMHAAVSTYQMGKPAICLSYSSKYQGVIGKGLGRDDLIIESNDNSLWVDGQINDLVINKCRYMLNNYKEICLDINKNVQNQRDLVKFSLDYLALDA